MKARIASLPMYDFTEIRPALDTFWHGLTKHLKREGVKYIPDSLSHDRPVQSLWSDPDLLVTQCCGYDLISRYKESLTPVAVPHFSAPGCSGSEYSSFIVVRDDNPATDVLEMKGSIAVINGPESHSGMSALRHLVASRSHHGRFFSDIKISGSHIDSIDFVKRGLANVAPIDCVTYALLEKHRPQTVWGLRVLGRTFCAPAPPYVILKSNQDQLAERFWNALSQAYDDPALRSARQNLFLKDVEQVATGYYDKIRAFEEHAANFDYPVLG
jgi:ABC-type phosphate/phosphonate transport system substrate-binding protein